MPRQLKVFLANYDGKSKVMAATTSATAFLKLVKEHPNLLSVSRDYVSETGNKYDVEIAMSKPGEIFKTPYDSKEWKIVE